MQKALLVDVMLQVGLALAITIVAVMVTQWVLSRQKALTVKSEQTAQAIAQLVRQREAEKRNAVIERIVERLPIGIAPENFVAALDAAVSKAITAEPRAATDNTAGANLIKSYHEQALTQANVQFVFSVIAALVGFAWVLWAGSQIDPKELVTVAKTIPGVVVDTVAYLFLKQAAETRQRATELFDRLRADRQGSDSVLLVAAIEDSRVRSAVRAQMALHMAGLQPQPIDVTAFLLTSPTAVGAAISPTFVNASVSAQNAPTPSATENSPQSSIAARHQE